ncbi:hypothetical protein D3C73_1626740 [compost metagenome]
MGVPRHNMILRITLEQRPPQTFGLINIRISFRAFGQPGVMELVAAKRFALGQKQAVFQGPDFPIPQRR